MEELSCPYFQSLRFQESQQPFWRPASSHAQKPPTKAYTRIESHKCIQQPFKEGFTLINRWLLGCGAEEHVRRTRQDGTGSDRRRSEVPEPTSFQRLSVADFRTLLHDRPAGRL